MDFPKIGAHVSAAGKLANGIVNAKAVGAECIQIFGASPRGWSVRGHAEGDIREFKRLREKERIGPVYLHGAYLVNLTSSDAAMRQKSEINLAEHLKIAAVIGAEGLIFHVGSGDATEAGLSIIVEAFKRILAYVPGRVQLIIENSAGGGQKVGGNPKAIGAILAAVRSPRVKVCWDTQHAYAAGLIEQYDEAGVDTMMRLLNEGLGVDNLVALHINDSKTVSGSRHDRHENLGEGHIGLSGFKVLAKRRELYRAAWILEVPGFDGNGPDRKNMELLRTCFTNP